MGAKLFGSDGSFLEQVEGQGPMEFSEPQQHLRGPLGPDPLIRCGNSRESILSDDLTLVEERRTPGLVMKAAELPPPHSYVASMHTGAMEPTTLPVHVIDSGSVALSFGDPEPHGSATVFRQVAVDQRGWIYSVSPDEYYIQGVEPLGRRLAGFRRESVLPPGDDQEFPRGFNSSVEVIDLAAARVVARSEFDALLGGFLGDGLVFGPTSTAIGEPQIGVWRLQLVER